jgi:hypothetical protein
MENHMKVVRAIYGQKNSGLYPRITVPVLLAPAQRTPENDQERAWQAARDRGIEKALALLPDARLEVMAGSPHDVPVFMPEHLARAIADFGAALP